MDEARHRILIHDHELDIHRLREEPRHVVEHVLGALREVDLSAPQQINESEAGKERGGGKIVAGIAHEHLSTVAHIRAGAIADHDDRLIHLHMAVSILLLLGRFELLQLCCWFHS